MWARWRGALGLRGRIIGVVLVTSVATLVIAAVALLGPLEQSLRNAEKTTLKQEFAGTRGTAPFTARGFDPGKVTYSLVKPPSPSVPSQGTGGVSIEPQFEDQRPGGRSAVQRGHPGAKAPCQGHAEPPVV